MQRWVRCGSAHELHCVLVDRLCIQVLVYKYSCSATEVTNVIMKNKEILICFIIRYIRITCIKVIPTNFDKEGLVVH